MVKAYIIAITIYAGKRRKQTKNEKHNSTVSWTKLLKKIPTTGPREAPLIESNIMDIEHTIVKNEYGNKFQSNPNSLTIKVKDM